TFLPIAINFYFAFTGGVELYPWRRPLTGTENLGVLFDCGNFLDPSTCRKDLFWRAIYNTATFALLQVGLMIGFALVTALVLNRKMAGRGFFRGVFFYPVLLSPVVVALIWKWILQREGVLNAVLASAGASPVGWLSDAHWAFFWTVFVSIWAHMGFYTLILLAGLQAIPGDLYEAAEMDGARPWRRFARITLPLLMPNLIVVMILGLIRAVQVFDEVFVLTGGGPGSATTFIVQFIYVTGFAEAIRQYGLAAAASLLLAFSLFVLTLLQLRWSRRSTHASGSRADA
ncbi:MAG: sugar ABC transporter permease, partial [Betaproteobacteria bacterium]